MSIRIMAAVFESKTLGPTERLVMLALADHADDDGKCYPSVLRLCERTGLSERAVQTNVKKLIEAGYLSVHFGGGKGHANLYFISANPAGNAPYEAAKPRTKCTPQEMHPAAGAPQTPQQVRSNPAADAPEPPGTTKEPSEKNARDARDIRQALAEAMSEETADAFIAHRKAKRAKLTLHAAQLIAKSIRGHPSPDAVVLLSIQNGWTGVFPDKTRATPANTPSVADIMAKIAAEERPQ